MNLEVKISQAITKFLDCKYAVDNPSEGYDCLNFLLSFYVEMGVELPSEFDGWTRENYGKRALENPNKAHKEFERFVQTLGEEVNINYMRPADLLLFAVKDLGTYAGVYLGNGHAFLIFDKGGRVCPLQFFRPHIKSARRLLK